MKLYQFPISHYCEKARWALDYKDLRYEQINLIPGAHLITVKKMAPNSSVPILWMDSSNVVQGSDKIIDYLDESTPKPRLSFTDSVQQAKATEIEYFLDQQVGPLLRTLVYHILLKYRKEVVALWSAGSTIYARWSLVLMFPMLRSIISKNYQIRADQIPDYLDRFNSAMDRLDRLYEDNMFLVGDRFSRVDLTAAALLSPLNFPPQHPFPPPIKMPDEFEDFCDGYRHRRVMNRVAELYRDYRVIAPQRPTE